MNLFPAACRYTYGLFGMDGNGLKLEEISQFFRVLLLRVPKILKKFIMVSRRRSFTEAFCL